MIDETYVVCGPCADTAARHRNDHGSPPPTSASVGHIGRQRHGAAHRCRLRLGGAPSEPAWARGRRAALASLRPFVLAGGFGEDDALFVATVGAWQGWQFVLWTAWSTALVGAGLAVVARDADSGPSPTSRPSHQVPHLRSRSRSSGQPGIGRRWYFWHTRPRGGPFLGTLAAIFPTDWLSHLLCSVT